MILPGETIGILGGGQLGRYAAVSARMAGYRVCVWDPDPESPAAMIADAHLREDFLSSLARDRFVDQVSAATLEFENIPPELMDRLSGSIRLSPGPLSVLTCQDRILEKSFLRKQGIPTVPYIVLETEDDVSAFVRSVLEGDQTAGSLFPAILKRSRWGYDGKGQISLTDVDGLMEEYRTLGSVPCLLEKRISLYKEISLILCGGKTAKPVVYPLIENVHVNGILHTSVAPARVDPELCTRAIEIGQSVMEALSHEGVLTVEFFIDQSGALLVNEMAPRPHNSGHLSLDSCGVSQFSQQIRILTGAPPIPPDLRGAAAMVNLLGDLWGKGEPDWSLVLSNTNARLHLYGKKESRPGRKMGHITLIAPSPDLALSEALALYQGIAGVNVTPPSEAPLPHV